MNRNLTPRGMEDIHFNEYKRTENIITKLKELYKSYGYRQIETPVFEYYDLFHGVEGTIDVDEMIKIIDDGKILVLRPDVTTPIARMAAASHSSCPGNLKFSYASDVFRMNDGRSGERRAFRQAGIEYLGNNKVEADGEVIALAIRSLLSSGITEFKIDVGQIGYFKGLLRELSLPSQVENSIRLVVENKQFPELEGLIAGISGSGKVKEALLAMPSLYGRPGQILQAAKRFTYNEQMTTALENLTELCAVLSDYGYGDYIDIDLGLVNHLDYYTGLVFKGYALHHGQEIISGGRYDNLTRQYGCEMAATGMGLNIDELLKAVSKIKPQEDKCFSHSLVLYTQGLRGKGLNLADALRNKGYIVETDCSAGDMFSIEKARCRDIRQVITVTDTTLRVLDVKTGVEWVSSEEEIIMAGDRKWTT